MAKQAKKIAGNLHYSAVDPAGVMPDKVANPFGLHNSRGPVGQAVAAAPGPAVMPDADSEAVAAAKRRKMAALKNRGGRASTILAGEETLGGG